MTEAAKRKRESHIWDREPDNWYIEPAWTSARLFEAEPFSGSVVDPCAGLGHIVESARAAGLHAHGFDLRHRPEASLHVTGGVDFFAPQLSGVYPVDNIVSNPPYGKRPAFLPGERSRWEEQFVQTALDRARGKVAVFLDAGWANSATRGEWLQSLSLYRVYKVGPRPPCPPGPVFLSGSKIGGGKTDYAWYVFLKGFHGAPTLHWLRR